ncbi:sorting nexin-2 [Homalodisca vitripennis]|nr:sorting nexin-2 [Homalodisca vitripennis]
MISSTHRPLLTTRIAAEISTVKIVSQRVHYRNQVSDTCQCKLSLCCRQSTDGKEPANRICHPCQFRRQCRIGWMTAGSPVSSPINYLSERLPHTHMVLPKATNTSALSGAGVMRLFNKVGETVNKITYKMDENDPWFEEKIQHLESLDGQLRKLLISVETLVIARRDLAMLTSAFAKSAAMLSNCEEHTSLSRALSQLADVEEKVESLHNEQANTDFSILCELLKDYVAMVGAIRDVFHERVKVYQNWQHSQLMLNKKREQKAKMDLANKTDKGTITNEIIEWEAKVERCQEEFTGISKMIKKEMERFEIERVKNFKSFIYKYLEEQMSHQHQLIKYWEAFLPEAKAIA